MKRWTALLMMLALLIPAFARAETTLYYNSCLLYTSDAADEL